MIIKRREFTINILLSIISGAFLFKTLSLKYSNKKRLAGIPIVEHYKQIVRQDYILSFVNQNQDDYEKIVEEYINKCEVLESEDFPALQDFKRHDSKNWTRADKILAHKLKILQSPETEDETLPNMESYRNLKEIHEQLKNINGVLYVPVKGLRKGIKEWLGAAAEHTENQAMPRQIEKGIVFTSLPIDYEFIEPELDKDDYCEYNTADLATDLVNTELGKKREYNENPCIISIGFNTDDIDRFKTKGEPRGAPLEVRAVYMPRKIEQEFSGNDPFYGRAKSWDEFRPIQFFRTDSLI